MDFSKIKVVFIVSLFFIFSQLLHGQSFYGGAMIGINGSQVGGDGLAGYNKAGFFAGGFVGNRFTPMSALRLELSFSQKGSKLIPTEKNGYTDYLLNENCIDIPLLYQCFLLTPRWMSFEVGLSYTYLIGAPKERGVDGTGENYIVPGTAPPCVASSMNFVAGVYFNITRNFFVNFRTVNGLTPFRKDPTRATHRLGAHGQYNDVLTLSVGYDFGKGSKE